MDVLDEKGRLFGVVNVVDAVAVLLVAAVVVAGASVVLSGDTRDTETRRATLSFGTQPEAAAALVEPGDTSLGGVDATVTDVYRTPTGGDRALVFARVSVSGRTVEGEFRIDGRALRYGEEFQVRSSTYRLRANVTGVGGDESFETVTRTVTVEATVSPAVADAVEAGDEHRVAGDTAATVTGVERVGRRGDRQVLRVTLDVRARTDDGVARYAGRRLRVGATLPFATDRYRFDGEIVAVER